MGTTIPLGEHPRQVLIKAEEWFVTVLCKGKVEISKMAIWGPYLSMDWNQLHDEYLELRGFNMQSFDKIPPLVREEMIYKKIQDSDRICRWTETKLGPTLGEHPRQFLIKSEEWTLEEM